MGGEGARVAGSANTADPGTLEGKKPTVRGSRFIHSSTHHLENYHFRPDVDITLTRNPEPFNQFKYTPPYVTRCTGKLQKW
jgi:hypothetical protein